MHPLPDLQFRLTVETLVEEWLNLLPRRTETLKTGLFAKLKQSLSKTRHQLGDGIGQLLLGKKEITQDLLDELETLLISADLGIETTQEVLKNVTAGLERKKLSDGNSVYDALKLHLQELTKRPFPSLILRNRG